MRSFKKIEGFKVGKKAFKIDKILPYSKWPTRCDDENNIT
jgi:hypothetical protein